MEEFKINTPKRQAAFIAQVGHESGQFVYVRELWGPTPAQRRYEPPGSLADDLGNTQPGDGKRFMGRGLIQITGRANYRACGAALGLDLIKEPELLEKPINACRSAAWFWATHGLNALADNGEFEKITRRINGGLNGQTERVVFYDAALKALA